MEPSDILDGMIEDNLPPWRGAGGPLQLERATLAIAERSGIGVGWSMSVPAPRDDGVQDGAELMPTFNWPSDRLLLLIAGGRDALLRSVEGAEDAGDRAMDIVRRHEIGPPDAMIAVAASGTTVHAACLRDAKARGALTVGVANNRDTPLSYGG